VVLRYFICGPYQGEHETSLDLPFPGFYFLSVENLVHAESSDAILVMGTDNEVGI